MTSGDGWIHCAQGHRHWGRYGAAGLLISDGHRVILQHRAPWTHEGGTWGVPGGARDRDESAVQAALREAGEEAGLAPGDITTLGLYLDDHGGWSYTTVLAQPNGPLFPVAANSESVTVEWVDIADVPALMLHSGFAQTWPQLSGRPESLHLIVARQLVGDPRLAQLREHGIDTLRLPGGGYQGALTRLLPTIHLAEESSVAELMGQHGANGLVLLVLEEGDLQLLA